jgi:hypothetical protein
MPIYNFDAAEVADGKKLVSMQFDPMRKDQVEDHPSIPQLLKETKQLTTILFEDQNIAKDEEVREILPKGYYTMDRGIKNYFAGIRVPTKDGVKLMQVRLSGGDKPYLMWAQDLKRGRVTLPVMSIKREGEEPFLDKFSPAHYHWFQKRFLDQDMTRIALSYRPISAKITYSLSVWAEHKRDLEYITYQIRSRFNPICEFFVEDEYFKCSIIMHYNGMTPAVDDDVPPDQRANKRYDFSIQMEGYLPLPEKVVPSILGRVTILKDASVNNYGDVLQVLEGKQILANISIPRS